MKSAHPLPTTRTLVAYDRRAIYALLRTATPLGLREMLRTGALSGQLTHAQRHALDCYLSDWVQRALGQMSLRDALLVDEQRGQRVLDLLCVAHTHDQVPLPDNLADDDLALLSIPSALPRLSASSPPHLPAPALAALLARAQQQELALATLGSDGRYPFPEDLENLTPPAPTPLNEPFVPPTGWRRRIAVLLAVSGVVALALPLMLGFIPRQAAGLPLALITLALLVGIRAGVRGYVGAFCLWMVANLPDFHYDSALSAMLWPAIPIMIVGMLLLGFDRQVRALWVWLRGKR
ncbi:MAG: hypothetical protein EI684_19625 [Candidatus Viridilinea halotolerans]|uniref:Uncharacterized protein n=1 Tax=Candidatus Viridilinea halotolerans TaxID=2491704 RepID=A0A426TSJ5_9CHLR|nr:MAG: hypothetical protein EI684_19625 [Candidatus Viridilinea halotolerans]